MAETIPAMMMIAFTTTAQAVATKMLAPDVPEPPQLADVERGRTDLDVLSDDARRTSSRIGSIQNAQGAPGGEARTGPNPVMLGSGG